MSNKKVNKKTNKKNIVTTENELINLTKIIVIVCVVLLAFYFITVLVNNKKNDNIDNSNDTTATIQYDEIIVGEILNRPENEYLVLVKKENDVNYDLYQSYLSIYSGKTNPLRVYNVDLGIIFNAAAVGEETVLFGDVQDFKFGDSTLIKVSNHEISQSFVGNEQIESYLKELIK